MKEFVGKPSHINSSRNRGHNLWNADVFAGTTRWVVVGIVALLVVLLAACGSPEPQPIHASPALADKVILYNWEEDIPQSVLDAFSEEYGVEVQVEVYESPGRGNGQHSGRRGIRCGGH